MNLHPSDAIQDGYRIDNQGGYRTDNDVLVLAIAFAGILQEQHVQQIEVLVAISTGSHFSHLAAALCATEHKEDR